MQEERAAHPNAVEHDICPAWDLLCCQEVHVVAQSLLVLQAPLGRGCIRCPRRHIRQVLHHSFADIADAVALQSIQPMLGKPSFYIGLIAGLLEVGRCMSALNLNLEAL